MTALSFSTGHYVWENKIVISGELSKLNYISWYKFVFLKTDNNIQFNNKE